MSSYTYTPPSAGVSGWFARAEAWLDDRGKPAWIAAFVIAMIVFWPVGLMLLAYMIWSGKLACNSRRLAHHRAPRGLRGGTGNSAFDAYRNETLRRLEDEQQSFEAFLDRLRAARDKAEFDQFMEDREKRARAADASGEDDAPDAPRTA